MTAAAFAAGLLASAAAQAQESPQRCGSSPWVHWTRYVESFVSPDGRVIDRSAADRSTSEGQAYAMFFALVANDRPLFARLLEWSEKNLADGDLRGRLPAWHWGKRRDGSWGVLDRNSASDADLWMAYALLEAGRLWSAPEYDDLGRRMLANVVAREVADLPGLGPMLLPGPAGFALEGGRAFRLNPSYEPFQLLQRFRATRVPGPWTGILASTARMLRETAPSGVVADWVLYRSRRGFAPDPVHGRAGSYDAIRTYLWAGMLAEDDPVRDELARALGGLLAQVARSGRVPERIDALSLHVRGDGPPGFAAALLPLARARNDAAAGRALEQRLSAAMRNDLYGEPPAYYDQNLALFGRGFVEGRFRFGADGALLTAWGTRCLGRAR
jgi:endoglucanase